MRPAAVLLAASALWACEEVELRPPQTDREREVRARSEADATLRAHLERRPPEALPPLPEFADDGGAGRREPAEAGAEAPRAAAFPPRTSDELLGGWEGAKVGDSVRARCRSVRNMFGNEVRREVEVYLGVVAADAETVTLLVAGEAAAVHDSSRPEVKRKHWTERWKASATVVMRRAPDGKLGLPLPPRTLDDARDETHALGAAKLAVRCSSLADAGEEVRRCVARSPRELYLSAGLISEHHSRDGACELLERDGPPPKTTAVSDAARWHVVQRHGARFRERVVAAASGMIRLESQRLRHVRAPAAGAVEVDGRHYQPDVLDARRLHALDWALESALPGFVPRLSLDQP